MPFRLDKCEGNPILSPNLACPWESLSVTNPGAWYDEDTGVVTMLCRCADHDAGYMRQIGLAVSRNGYHFERVSDRPVLSPCPDAWDAGPVEDPRIIKMGDWYYVTYAGNPDVQSPVLDALARESTNVTHAVSGCPVCCPYRASLMTGQYPITHGVYINDVELDPQCDSIARAFGRGGYQTAYIGKWHLYGSPDGRYGRRHAYVPRECQLGFDYWKGYECTHDYNDSHCFFNEDDTRRPWGDYDALAQSRDAADCIHAHVGKESPFLLMLSWGPPHFPLHTAPQEYRDRYAGVDITLRPNVPKEHREAAREQLRGNYAHISALDGCLAVVLDAVESSGQAGNTMVVFTSDHGDMFGSHGMNRKCVPWDESIRVPFLIRWPNGLKGGGRDLALPLDAPDIMPTLLGLCGLPVPATVGGADWSDLLLGRRALQGDEAALLSFPAAFTNVRRYGFKAWAGRHAAAPNAPTSACGEAA